MPYTWVDVTKGQVADDVAINALGNQVELHDVTLQPVTSAWTNWTPILTNLTVGAGGFLLARHRLVGKTLDWRFKFRFGTGSAVGNDPKFTLAYAPHSSYVATEDELGRGVLLDTTIVNRDAIARLDSGSTVLLLAYSTTGAHATISATAPWTWGIGDVMSFSGTIEIA